MNSEARESPSLVLATLTLLITLVNAAGVLLVNGKVDHLTGRTDHLTGRVDHLTDRVDYLTGRVDHLTGRVDALQAVITAQVNADARP